MCDETNQLPNSAPMFTGNTAGGSWTLAGNNPLRHCVSCGFWYTGYHDCGAVTLAPNAGFAIYPQPTVARTQTERKPHVCPVCTGKGEVPDGEVAKRCPACKGECVLWG